MIRTNNSLIVCRLTPEQHAQTCGYWYTVTQGAMAHTAFETRAGLDKWMRERGLTLDGELSDKEWGWCHIKGEYRECSHLHDADTFEQIHGDRTRTLSNSDYVVAILERGSDGIITVHTLNPNVRNRQTFNHHESRLLMK